MSVRFCKKPLLTGIHVILISFVNTSIFLRTGAGGLLGVITFKRNIQLFDGRRRATSSIDYGLGDLGLEIVLLDSLVHIQL